MSPSGHPSLRTRIAVALEEHLNENSNASVGARLGRVGTTIARRGSDLREWPADELLHMAAHDAAIGGAVCDYIRGDQAPTGRAEDVDVDLDQALIEISNFFRESATALSGDRHCDLDEARAMMPDVDRALALLSKAKRDLADKIARGAR